MVETLKPKLIAVRVVPNAAKNTVVGWEDPPGNLPGFEKVLRVRLAAPPVDGKANDALLKFLAEIGNVSRREIILRTGTSSRLKTLEVPAIWSLPESGNA